MKFHLFFFNFLLMLSFISCSNNDENEEYNVPRRVDFNYTLSVDCFSSDGGRDSVWTDNVVLVYRDDTTIVYGNSARSLEKDTLPNNRIVHRGEWYEIIALYTDSCYMCITVYPNESHNERHDDIYVLLDNMYQRLPITTGHFTIRQEGKKTDY